MQQIFFSNSALSLLLIARENSDNNCPGSADRGRAIATLTLTARACSSVAPITARPLEDSGTLKMTAANPSN